MKQMVTQLCYVREGKGLGHWVRDDGGQHERREILNVTVVMLDVAD
jgi:hypothetical protein